MIEGHAIARTGREGRAAVELVDYGLPMNSNH
jgi:hypothetical protein